MTINIAPSGEKDLSMQVLSVNYHDTDAPIQFCKSLNETGFAILNNHPVDQTLLQQALSEWKAFFHSDRKIDFSYQKPSQDGYFPFKTENAKDSSVSDLKEFYHFYTWGKVPPELKEISTVTFNALKSLASDLLIWIESQLPEPLKNKLSMPLHQMIEDSPNTLLRILHYPPLSTADEPGAVRAAPHEDINLITLLPAATAPGLEVKDIQGNWHAVDCNPGSIVVNVGDMLQECTQHFYKSTTHRVVNPMGEAANESRFSMPLFLHSNGKVKLTDELTAEQYLNHRLREIGIL
jgi:isopenicillin N synthase-like dioxygenase